MRDLVVVAIYLPLLGLALKDPFAGVIMWFLVSFMSLHTLAYGFSATLPWAYIVGGVTVFSWLLSRGKTKFVWNKVNVTFIFWGLWIQVTTYFALNYDEGVPLWEKFIKIWSSTLIASMFFLTRERIIALVAVMAGSLAFYGVKGGIHFLLSGSLRVTGPPRTSLADNNDLGLGLVMMLPLMWYLRSQMWKPWQKHSVTVACALSLLAAIATNSRGAYVAIAATSASLWWKARGKIRLLIAGATLGFAIYSILPQEVFDRINSISSYQTDKSAEDRLAEWAHGWKVFKSRPLLGGGLGTFRINMYRMYNEPVPPAVEAHSIYFEVLGDQGAVGFALFVCMWLFAYSSARWIRRRTRGVPDQQWAYDLAFYYQLSLISYATCGAFLSQSYLDLYYALLMGIGMTRYVVQQSLVPAASGVAPVVPFNHVTRPPGRLAGRHAFSQFVKGPRAEIDRLDSTRNPERKT